MDARLERAYGAWRRDADRLRHQAEALANARHEATLLRDDQLPWLAQDEAGELRALVRASKARNTPQSATRAAARHATCADTLRALAGALGDAAFAAQSLESQSAITPHQGEPLCARQPPERLLAEALALLTREWHFKVACVHAISPWSEAPRVVPAAPTSLRSACAAAAVAAEALPAAPARVQ
jgi:hypothetical protein